MSTNEAAARPATAEWPDPGYAWYVVGVLMVAYTVSFIDRQIISLLVEPIKADLGVSDTEIGLLQGLAFALFYTTLGIPIARLADRHSRRRIISIGITVWCLMTALCGLAKNFPQLFLARMGVGVGEAALSPAAYSIISDYFPRQKLGRALSVYGMGIYVGSGLALIIGGAVVQLVAQTPDVTVPLFGTLRSWQLAFIVVGLPGLLVVALMYTVREPERRGSLLAGGQQARLSIGEVVGFVWQRRRAFLGHFFGFALLALIGYGVLFWVPTFYVRTYGWTIPEAALPIGVVTLVLGTAGIFGGGMLADWLLKRGHRDAPIRAGIVGAVGLCVGGALAPLAPGPWISLVGWMVAIFFLAFPFGVSAAALQMMTPNQMRAQVSSLYLFVTNAIGLALGPNAVAFFTDFVFRDEARIGHSMAAVAVIVAPLAAVLLWYSLPACRRSMAEADQWND